MRRMGMGMVGTSQALLLAVAAFVGGHFVLSSVAVREPLIKTFGLNGFRVLYSVFAAATLAWVVVAYRAAPHVELWPATAGLRHLPLMVMPFACIFVVAGVTTASVTMFAGERHAEGPRPVWGIATVTRHPVLWGIGLWAVAHLIANGDLASVTLFGGLAVLAFGGMPHIDYRRRTVMGAAWGPVALTTSVIPFLAAIQGRTKIDWAGIGIWRVLGGVALYLALATTHGGAIGVNPFAS
jgi:uncharacterized membrane protein